MPTYINGMIAPDPGDVFIHLKTGNAYRVLLCTNLQVLTNKMDKFPPTVVYKPIHSAETFSRPLWSWKSSFRLEREAHPHEADKILGNLGCMKE